MIRKVLIVDDAEDIRFLGEAALSATGDWEVHTAGSGAECLEKAPALKPDVILMDVQMPILDGPTTLARLRLMPGIADTPVIFLTGRVEPEAVAELRALGAAAVLPKPFDPISLPQEILDVLLATK